MTERQLPGGVPLPAGMELCPQLGAGVAGTRPRQSWVVLTWFSAAIMVGLAVLFLVVSQSGRGNRRPPSSPSSSAC